MQNFEAVILPNEEFKGKTIYPNERPSMAQWFEETRASKAVPKKPTPPERHVFNIDAYQKRNKPKLLTFWGVFRNLRKTLTNGNDINQA
jgi:hypothetical protein